jgi:rubrerythrin
MTINQCLAKLEEEKEHSAFLEKLLRTLYGDGWNKLTISDAKKWHTKHIASQPSVEDGSAEEWWCPYCENLHATWACPICGDTKPHSA